MWSNKCPIFITLSGREVLGLVSDVVIHERYIYGGMGLSE